MVLQHLLNASLTGRGDNLQCRSVSYIVGYLLDMADLTLCEKMLKELKPYIIKKTTHISNPSINSDGVQNDIT